MDKLKGPENEDWTMGSNQSSEDVYRLAFIIESAWQTLIHFRCWWQGEIYESEPLSHGEVIPIPPPLMTDKLQVVWEQWVETWHLFSLFHYILMDVTGSGH